MVLTVHIDGASLGLPSAPGTEINTTDIWKLAVEAAAITGVNCFTMISGYFGIRLRAKGVASFLFQCLFYSVGIYSACMIVRPQQTSFGEWMESWLVLSQTDLWYVPAYFCLMLLSPILNAGIDALGKQKFGITLSLFALFTFWCGWWWDGKFNPTGYTAMQLILMYMIARYFRLHVSPGFLKSHRLMWGAGFTLFTAGIFLTSLWLPYEKAFAYNAPLVVLATISLFCFFTTFSFKSRFVNYAAKSAFAVYLIHKNPLIWGNLMRPGVNMLWDSMSLWQFSIATCGLIAGIYAASMAADALRRIVWNALSSPLSTHKHNR